MKLTSADRRAIVLLFSSSWLLFAYFFQGDGWAHHANYSTIRSLVERGSFEITSLREKTGDVSIRDGRVYSNKPPGLPLIGAAPYWLITRVEVTFGIDPSKQFIDQVNQWLMTAILCALPAAMTVTMMFLALRYRGVSTRHSGILSLAFGAGSLLLPYSGMLYNHVLVAACVFTSFLLLTSTRSIVLPSLLLGIACISEYVVIPLVVLFLVHEWLASRNFTRVAALSIGPTLAVLGLMWFQHHIFGSPFTPTYAFEAEGFREQTTGAARFHFPEWSRLYWITWGRMRGLFYCCPIFLLPLMASLFARRRPNRREVLSLSIVAYFVLVLLTYKFWAGGYGVGPRFAIPALPFLFLFVVRAYERLPWLTWVVIALSTFNMVAVTSVRAEFPGNDQGPPQHWDPVGVCTLDLLRGQIAQPANSSNLGLKLGLPGVLSLVPFVLILLGAELAACYLSDSAALASGRTAADQRAYIAPDGCSPSPTTSSGSPRESEVTST